MRKGFKQLIIGFILILLEIHIFVDFLPDPLGYFLIFSGIVKLERKKESTHPAGRMAILLMLVSIPTFFISQQSLNQPTGGMEWWGYYGTILSILKIILVYFIFQLIRNVVQTLHSVELAKRTESMYRWYMGVMLIVTFIQPFLINFSGNGNGVLIIVLIASALIIEIVFLFFLRSIQKEFKVGQSGNGEIIDYST
jgi:hypothetical protein